MPDYPIVVDGKVVCVAVADEIGHVTPPEGGQVVEPGEGMAVGSTYADGKFTLPENMQPSYMPPPISAT